MPPADHDSIADFLGWLGRQVGHIAKAVRSDVTQPPANQVVYREERVHEQSHPEQPDVLLRRTVVDEVIVQSAPRLDQAGGSADEHPT